MSAAPTLPAVSLATQALALYSRQPDGMTIPEIAVYLFGEDTIGRRQQVNALIDEGRRKAAGVH